MKIYSVIDHWPNIFMNFGVERTVIIVISTASGILDLNRKSKKRNMLHLSDGPTTSTLPSVRESASSSSTRSPLIEQVRDNFILNKHPRARLRHAEDLEAEVERLQNVMKLNRNEAHDELLTEQLPRTSQSAMKIPKSIN
ncbi:hypothetical protein FRC02_011841 [Tulasnella sp. 418]|nr:hypothetical protein FRC02_011841 [Tulasnella sp. 418]